MQECFVRRPGARLGGLVLGLALTTAAAAQAAAGAPTASAPGTAATPSAPAPASPAAATPAAAQSRFLAPGFSGLTQADSVVLMPIDVELFSISAGGVLEPKADWTAKALGHMKAEIGRLKARSGLDAQEMSEQAADEFAEQIGLHTAVARAVSLHHAGNSAFRLPSKADKLDWSLAETMQPIRARTGARYGLFVWVRDSYASGERVATSVLLAVLTMGNVIVGGGVQVGYASLVDLETGRLVWFNELARGSGDLREAAAATETVQELLKGFPLPR